MRLPSASKVSTVPSLERVTDPRRIADGHVDGIDPEVGA